MTQDLFRREAVEFSTQRLYGHVVVLPRISHVVAFGFIAICVAMLIATLLTGTHVEKRAIGGVLSYANSESEIRIDAQLFVPQSLASRLSVGQRLQVRMPELATRNAPRLAALVDSISDEVRLLPAAEGRPAILFAPVTLRIDSLELRKAGLPELGSYELRIEADLTIGEKSWLRWLIDAVTQGSGRP